jgi:gamma-glutamyltranspeptidase/glutathione hydrolase
MKPSQDQAMFEEREAVISHGGMVTSPHHLASEAGAAVLRDGGSAVDAAIATAAVLAVIYPHMTGMGGDAFWLIHDPLARKVRYLDGGGRAFAGANPEFFRSKGLSEVPFRGIWPATLTTPGAVASWSAAHQAHGRLSMAHNLAAAVAYAREGYPVSARLSGWIQRCRDDCQALPGWASLFLPEGDVPVPGSQLANPALARTLQAVAEGGALAFYGGEVGAQLARFAQAHGGFFSASDLAAQTAKWGEPLKGTYRDLTLFQTPAPTQGFTVLQMLKLVEPLGLNRMDLFDPQRIHWMVQAKQISYHDRDRWLGDPAFVDVPMDVLLSDAYLDQRRALMNPSHALAWDKVPSYGSLRGDTVYIATVDAQGQAVSLIHSLYGAFGSGVVDAQTGVLLQNRSAYFSLAQGHPNELAPGKVPLHTLIASMGFKNDALWSVMGCMGADGQPQIQFQTYCAMVDHGLDIQQAVQMPRWLSGRFALGEARDTLHVESRIGEAALAGLTARGHSLNRWGPWNELAGHAHGLIRDPHHGHWLGGADPRSDGRAVAA